MIKINEQVKIAWGKHISAHPMHIKDASNGKACDCLCYECNAPLVAKQGISGNQVWHFAHEGNSKCNGMSALHKVAQQIFENASGLHVTTPELRLRILSDSSVNGCGFNQFVSPRNLLIESIELEKVIGQHRMDVVCKHNSDKQTIFEIAVTNRKSDADIQIFIASSLHVVEIDLSSLPWDAGIDEIAFALFKQQDNRQFISHSIMKQRDEWIEKNLIIRRKREYEEEEEQRIEEENTQRLIDNEIKSGPSKVNSLAASTHCVNFTVHGYRSNSIGIPVDDVTIKPIELSKTKTGIQNDGNFFWYKAIANSKTLVSVCFMPFSDITLMQKFVTKHIATPALVCNGYSFAQYHWFNVEDWEAKALDQAKMYPFGRRLIT
jgi:hypothetical protein